MDDIGELVSVNEAAVITGVPLEHVHRMVDQGMLEGCLHRTGGRRFLKSESLTNVYISYSMADVLVPDARRRLCGLPFDDSAREIRLHEFVVIDVNSAREIVVAGACKLDVARKAVVSDPAILGGELCVRGTRVPVHDVADMVANGDTPQSVLDAYPSLDRTQFDLALVFAQAYPRRGRPRAKAPWRDAARRSVTRVRMADLPAA